VVRDSDGDSPRREHPGALSRPFVASRSFPGSFVDLIVPATVLFLVRINDRFRIRQARYALVGHRFGATAFSII
jgi:hypothetical protein